MSDEPVSVYVDASVVSGLAKQDFPDATIADFFRVLDCARTGRADLWVTELVDDEIKGVPEEHRYYHTLVLKLLREMPYVPERMQTGLQSPIFGFISAMPAFGMGRPAPDKRYQAIEDVLTSGGREPASVEMDAKHLYQCLVNEIDLFWTEDRRSILQHQVELAKLGLSVVDTATLLSQLQAPGS